MNFEEKHNLVLETVEKNCDKDFSEVVDILERTFGSNSRQISEAFIFNTGSTLNAYYKELRLKKIYQYKKDADCSFDEAAAKFGTDASTFSRSFKKSFGIAPTQITEDDFSKLPNEYSLDTILNRERDATKLEKPQETIFGISTEKYKQLTDIFKYKAVYDFDDENAQYAYEISQKYCAPLNKSFEFVDQCYWSNHDPEMFLNIDKYDFFSAKSCAYLYFNYGLTINKAYDELYRLNRVGVVDIFEEPEEIMHAYLSNLDGYWDYPFFKTLYDIMSERGIIDFYEEAIKEGKQVCWNSCEDFLDELAFLWDPIDIDEIDPSEDFSPIPYWWDREEENSDTTNNPYQYKDYVDEDEEYDNEEEDDLLDFSYTII